MCVKFPPGDLNPDPYPPHPTNIYTCEMTTALRICGGIERNVLRRKFCRKNKNAPLLAVSSLGGQFCNFLLLAV